MRSITESQREHILADLIDEVADADIPLDALSDGAFLKSFFEAKGFETGYDSEGNPREDEALAVAIAEDAYEHFERLEDIVIAIGFYDKRVKVTSRYEYIDFFLVLDPDRATKEEIERAENKGSGFRAYESVREAYNAMRRWDFSRRIASVKKIMDGDSKYTAEAEDVYFDLRALWVDQIIAGVEGKLNPEANKTGLPYDEWCGHYAACACDEVDDFSEVDIPARHAKDGKAFTVWFKAPEELE